MYTIGSVGNGNGEFNGNLGLALNSNNELFVVDEGNFRIQSFSMILTANNIFVNGLYTNDFNVSLTNFTNEYNYTNAYIVYRTNNIIYADNLFVEFR